MLRCETTERAYDLVLAMETIQAIVAARAHHELQIVDDDVRNVVDVNSMRHCLA